MLGRADVWGVVACHLPLWWRAASSRVCKAWKGVVEGEGVDYSVATLCCAIVTLGQDPLGQDRARGRLGAWREKMGEERVCVIETLLCNHKPACSYRYFRCPETWVKIALMGTELGWIHRGAMRTRIDLDWEKCELGWGRVHHCAAVGDVDGVREELARGQGVGARSRERGAL